MNELLGLCAQFEVDLRLLDDMSTQYFFMIRDSDPHSKYALLQRMQDIVHSMGSTVDACVQFYECKLAGDPGCERNGWKGPW